MIREQRQVGLKTVFDLIKRKRILLTLGLVFTLLPVFFGIVFLMLSSSLDADVPKVDYDLVDSNGSATKAIITSIETQENITINNDHPSIICYEYKIGYKKVGFKNRVLSPVRVSEMQVGDSIDIKYLDNNSIIVGLKPFLFPMKIVLGIVAPILITGIILLLVLYLRVKKEINLYTNGEVRDAEIISMTPKNGLPISGIGQGVTVHYQYKTVSGQGILSESLTSDFTILNSKKQGDLIKIFVSVDDESKSCLISKLDQIRNNWKIE